MEQTITYIGLDVHKTQIDVAVADGGRDGEVRSYGSIASDAASVAKLLSKLGRGGRRLSVCYEAGPCGYGLYRQVIGLGHACAVVAPSLIPRRPGDRVKTNRRDAVALARLDRAGELTAVWVPDAAHEAMRDLVRARLAAMVAERQARQQLQGFLLRQGRIYEGRTSWGRAHRRWLATLGFDCPAHRLVLVDLLAAVEAAGARRARLEADIVRLLPDWSLAPVVEAWQALRGVSTIAAIVLAAELGDVTRFDSPRQLMAYLGLVPSEHSSGDKRRRGAITKAGNRHARRILVEGAWSYRLPARLSRAKLRKIEPLPKPVRDIAEKAQQRLCPRYRRLIAKGRPANLVTVAIAREMAAFLWAIATVTLTAATAPPDA